MTTRETLSDERDTALERVREAVMWVNAAIACNKTEDYQ